MVEERKKHCWECRRRRLVCDFTQPGCARCAASGVDCPGYSETRPTRLQWLAPGKVKAHNRRSKKEKEEEERRKEEEKKRSVRLSGNSSDSSVSLPPPVELHTDVHAMIQAVQYYNACIIPRRFPTQDMGPTPFIYTISPSLFQMGMNFPDHVRMNMVCMTLTHQMNRTRADDPYSAVLAKRFLRYRGYIIRSLHDDLNFEHKRKADLTIAGILNLLLTDAQQDVTPSWRLHLDGAQKLIKMRGGMRALADVPRLHPLMVSFVSIVVVSDTTSPASNMAMATWQLEDFEFIIEQYARGQFDFHACPVPIFTQIVKTNHLRIRAASTQLEQEEEGANPLAEAAYGVLSSIYAFSADRWAESKPSSKEDWALVGAAYQAAAALFCIRSLQSQGVLPINAFLRDCCSTHSQLLQVLLTKVFTSPKTELFIIWPLVTLGVEAVHGGAPMRRFVSDRLADLSRFVGTSNPLEARNILQRFWASGGDAWDDCFDRPCFFTTQMAVDVSRLHSST